MTPDPSTTLRDLLAFYLEVGVDTALSDDPVNRLEFVEEAVAPIAAPQKREIAGLAPARPAPIKRAEISPDAACAAAEKAALASVSLDELRNALASFEGCALRSTATQLVFADGNPAARIMFVGDSPERDDDIEGRPFLGTAGALFDRMLAAIKLDRTKVYLANVIPWRPPGNRAPTQVETRICLPFIRRQIQLADPDILVTLGNFPTQMLLGTRDGIMKSRGRWAEFDTGSRKIRAIATFNPGLLLTNPTYKRLAWEDLQDIEQALAELPPRA